MATTTGTAAGHLALLTALRDFLKTQSWTVVGGPNTGAITAAHELFMQAPGVNGQQPKVGFKPYQDGATYWNLAVAGLTTFNAGLNLNDQANRSDLVYLLASNGALPYRFNANATACWGWFRFGSVYQPFSIGFILPQHLPDDWPYPLFIGGSGRLQAAPISTQNRDNRAFFDTYEGARLCMPGGVWAPIANVSSNESVDGSRRGIAPWHGYFDHVGLLAQGLSGGKPLTRSLVLVTTPETTAGHIQGVYHITGQGTTAESTVTEGAMVCECIPNVFRVGMGDWCAMEIG